MTSTTIRLVTGGLVSVQDLGRTRTSFGLSSNGASDQFAARAANALVGNDANEPLLETTLMGFAVEVEHEVLVAVTGASATITVDDVPIAGWVPFVVPAGATIRTADLRDGNYVYLAVAGHWDVDLFAGSAASDLALGFSNQLSIGNTVIVRDIPTSLTNPWLGVPLIRAPRLQPLQASGVIDIMPGPDTTTIPGVEEALTANEFRVDPRSNFVGVRLTGPLPSARPSGEILSHGVAIGAIELPPSDELIILQRGRSLTAGYPVVAVVSRASQDTVAQLVPGSSCRMRWCDSRTAIARARKQRRDLEHTTAIVRAVLSHLHTSAGVAA